MQRDTDQDWIRLGEADPYFGVVGDARFHIGRVDDQLVDEFYQMGEGQLSAIYNGLQQAVPEFAPVRALDFGCGAGRHTLAIARRAREVTGLDVAPGMTRRAEEAARQRGLANCHFVNALPEEGRWDWINSYQVFQHILPSRGYEILDRLFDRLEFGGVCSLQFTLFRDRRHVPLQAGHFWNYDGVSAEALSLRSSEGVGQIILYDYDMNHLLAKMITHQVELRGIMMTEHGGHHGAWLFGLKDPAALMIEPGRRYEARPGASFARFLGEGWSEIEDWGVWSSGAVARLTLRVPAALRGSHMLRLHGEAFVNPGHPQIVIEAFVNSHLAGRQAFTEADKNRGLEIRLQEAGEAGTADLRLKIHSPASPVECGLDVDDSRELGFGLTAITLEPFQG